MSKPQWLYCCCLQICSNNNHSSWFSLLFYLLASFIGYSGAETRLVFTTAAATSLTGYRLLLFSVEHCSAALKLFSPLGSAAAAPDTCVRFPPSSQRNFVTTFSPLSPRSSYKSTPQLAEQKVERQSMNDSKKHTGLVLKSHQI